MLELTADSRQRVLSSTGTVQRQLQLLAVADHLGRRLAEGAGVLHQLVFQPAGALVELLGTAREPAGGPPRGRELLARARDGHLAGRDGVPLRVELRSRLEQRGLGRAQLALRALGASLRLLQHLFRGGALEARFFHGARQLAVFAPECFEAAADALDLPLGLLEVLLRGDQGDLARVGLVTRFVERRAALRQLGARGLQGLRGGA